jgi:hypothetical protein
LVQGKKDNKDFAAIEKTTEHEISISQCTGMFGVLSVKLLHVENGFCSTSRISLRQNEE